MQTIRRFIYILTGLAVAAVIVLLQCRNSLSSPRYLEQVAQRAQVAQRVTDILPDYAAAHLPDAESAKQAIKSSVSRGVVQNVLDTLFQAVSDSYKQGTAVVLDTSPITNAVANTSYVIPPGTVLATTSTPVISSPSFLHSLARATWPVTLLAVVLIGLSVLIGRWRGVSGVLLVAAVTMLGLVAALYVVPSLIASLLNSNHLNPAFATLIQSVVKLLAQDAAHVYLLWAAVFLVLAALSFVGRFVTRRRPHKPKPDSL